MGPPPRTQALQLGTWSQLPVTRLPPPLLQPPLVSGRNGVWHARARTPAEERSHRGGSGPKRTQRRQDRVQQYLAGEWRPAWLEKYIQDRKIREETLEAETTQAVAQPDPSPTPSTDPDPWSGQWQDSWWNSWSWSSSWDGWRTLSWTSTTTSTSPAAGQELGFPNDGLMPEVHDVDPQELAEIVWTMQLTQSERALLLDAGTPEAVVHRISDLFERLEDHDSLERGPEARCALGRLVRRMDEAIENQGVILQVMMRRLQVRGRWPVVRVPAQEMERWRLFTWIRQFGGSTQTRLSIIFMFSAATRRREHAGGAADHSDLGYKLKPWTR